MNATLRNYCLTIVVAAGLGACSSNPVSHRGATEAYQLRSPPTGNELSANSAGDSIAVTATAMLGSPYRWGGSGPDSFDCSGLVHYAYLAAGYSVPRTSAAQYRAATPIKLNEARPGDLLFFSFERKVSHVGIYLGDRQFVHAPATGGYVSIESLSHEQYREHFVGAGRILD